MKRIAYVVMKLVEFNGSRSVRRLMPILGYNKDDFEEIGKGSIHAILYGRTFYEDFYLENIISRILYEKEVLIQIIAISYRKLSEALKFKTKNSIMPIIDVLENNRDQARDKIKWSQIIGAFTSFYERGHALKSAGLSQGTDLMHWANEYKEYTKILEQGLIAALKLYNKDITIGEVEKLLKSVEDK